MIRTKAAWHVEGESPDEDNPFVGTGHLRRSGKNPQYHLARFDEKLRLAKGRRHTQRGRRAKEHPFLRQVIINHKLTPFPSVELWDGWRAFHGPEPPRGLMNCTSLSMGLAIQMGRMIAEGFFNEANFPGDWLGLDNCRQRILAQVKDCQEKIPTDGASYIDKTRTRISEGARQ